MNVSLPRYEATQHEPGRPVEAGHHRVRPRTADRRMRIQLQRQLLSQYGFQRGRIVSGSLRGGLSIGFSAVR
jgi:hypothetical protein